MLDKKDSTGIHLGEKHALNEERIYETEAHKSENLH